MPSPQRAWRTRSPSRNWRSPGMIGRAGRRRPRSPSRRAAVRASRSSSQARTGRASEPDGAPSAYASRFAARSRAGPERLAGRRARRAGRSPAGRRAAGAAAADGRPEPARPPRPEDEVEVEVAVVRLPPSCGPSISSAGISSRNRDGTDAWPIPHVARRQACDRYSRRLARVIPTYARRRSSSSSVSSSSARLCGKRPSSSPAMKTTGNSRPLAAWSVISVTASASPSYESWSATRAVSSSSRSSASSGRQVVVAGRDRAQLEQVGPALLAVLGAVGEHRPVARRLEDLVEQLGQGRTPTRVRSRRTSAANSASALRVRGARPGELARGRPPRWRPRSCRPRAPRPRGGPRSSCRRCPRAGHVDDPLEADAVGVRCAGSAGRPARP